MNLSGISVLANLIDGAIENAKLTDLNPEGPLEYHFQVLSFDPIDFKDEYFDSERAASTLLWEGGNSLERLAIDLNLRDSNELPKCIYSLPNLFYLEVDIARSPTVTEQLIKLADLLP